jgi:hypothetical protein
MSEVKGVQERRVQAKPKFAGPYENPQQVFVRHAFRFWMGRNETLNDAPVLQAACQASRDSNGSMKALLTFLPYSDAFLYRHVTGWSLRHPAIFPL